MKRFLSLILIVIFVCTLSGCKRNDDSNDIATPNTETENTQKDDAPIKEDEPIEEEPPITLSLQICVIEDSFIAGELLDDKSVGVQINMDTSKHDFMIYDVIGIKDNLIALDKQVEYTYDSVYNKTLMVEYTAQYDDIIDFGFDPDSIDGYASVLLKCPGFLIVSYKNRPLIVKSENYNDFEERDHLVICGKASLLEVPVEYNYGRNTHIKYEVKDANVSEYYFREEEGAIIGAKPVIYLYPEKSTNVSVSVDLEGKFTCVYPEYNGLWQVNAKPDGRLTDKNGREYYCLYWEGAFDTPFNNPKDVGFVVKGEDTAEFLREKALALGLNEREANEFIIYWLPQLQDNAYNYIYFSIDEYKNKAKLNITPAADTEIRFMMLYKPLDKKITVKEQILPKAPKRCGFSVVEWGGALIK